MERGSEPDDHDLSLCYEFCQYLDFQPFGFPSPKPHPSEISKFPEIPLSLAKMLAGFEIICLRRGV
jgi:hypothetical protein